MKISNKISEEITIKGNKCIPYAKLNQSVQQGAYMIQDSRPRDGRYYPTAYCPCVPLSVEVLDIDRISIGSYPSDAYAVLSPDQKLLGIIVETRMPMRMLKIVKDKVDTYNKFMSVEHDSCAWVDTSSLSIIQVMCNDFTLSDYVIRSNDLTCRELEGFYAEIKTAHNYCLWEDFRKESSKTLTSRRKKKMKTWIKVVTGVFIAIAVLVAGAVGLSYLVGDDDYLEDM